MNQKITKCFVYARVSTDEQASGQYSSIDSQIDICKHYIEIQKEKQVQAGIERTKRDEERKERETIETEKRTSQLSELQTEMDELASMYFESIED